MRYWLKEFRTQRGFTQSKVAELSGIERSYYTMIEKGNRNPSVFVAKSIASTLGFEWTIFFEKQCNETKHNQSKEVI
ncbi:DNA-binding transcriptional regulator, XRE-family HTH domain [Thalassobacillus cyri]|uniref:DNA-binding transcriptional regulator, XRE-family HTH domain n=1 Tax=Thalassobacillus cyri TaxID=571932 RepID=A0A1H4BXN1_9BACI|nr:helix-turn-helix transcriptional regulator [Thalassobacillus cyri]SEA52830.1 DNA-binding transcriptional regulator, XRE-family HTH domain [Thalassobacillus cyri]